MDFADVRRAMAIAILETEGTCTHWAIQDLWYDWERINAMQVGDVLYWYYRNGGTGCSDERFDEQLTKMYNACWTIKRIGKAEYTIE